MLLSDFDFIVSPFCKIFVVVTGEYNDRVFDGRFIDLSKEFRSCEVLDLHPMCDNYNNLYLYFFVKEKNG